MDVPQSLTSAQRGFPGDRLLQTGQHLNCSRKCLSEELILIIVALAPAIRRKSDEHVLG
jgi:hypothetical protein